MIDEKGHESKGASFRSEKFIDANVLFRILVLLSDGIVSVFEI